MDLAKIKESLAKLEKSNGGRVEYSKYFWRPKELGTYTIRVVPSKFNSETPFTELAFHTKIRQYPMLSLISLGKQDPVEDFRDTLYKTKSKENWSLAGKLSPRVRYTVPIIVRREEDQGVRLWEISQTVFKAFLQMATDEEIGDFTDVVNGCDIKVTRTQGTQFIEIGIRAARNSSPLSTDPKQVELWLNDQPVPLECYPHYSYEYIKEELGKFLSGGTATDGRALSSPTLSTTTPVAPKTEVTETFKVSNTTVAPKTEPVAPEAPLEDVEMKKVHKTIKPESLDSKFDDLFKDEVLPGTTVEDATDKLPF